MNASCMDVHELDDYETSVSVFGKKNEYVNFIAPMKATCIPYLRGTSIPTHHFCCYCWGEGGSMWPKEFGSHSFSFILLILWNYCQVFFSTVSYHFPFTNYILCKQVTTYKSIPFSREGNLPGKLCLLEGGMSKNLWTDVKMTIIVNILEEVL